MKKKKNVVIFHPGPDVKKEITTNQYKTKKKKVFQTSLNAKTDVYPKNNLFKLMQHHSS